MSTYITKGAGDAGLAIIIGLVVGLIAAQLFGTAPKPADAQQSAVFDHSNCQYPDRWSNPPNGCDNSDPAVPECIKAFSTKEGEDACIAAFSAEHTELPAVTTPAPISEPVQCGGK